MKSSSLFTATVLSVASNISHVQAFSVNHWENIITNKGSPRRILQSNTVLEKNAIQIRGGSSRTESSMALSAVPGWVAAAGVAAPIASMFLSLSALPTIRNIIKNKSVGDLPLMPYSSLVANSVVWLTYGILKKEVKVWSCNSFSVVLGLYYFASFARFSPKVADTLPGSISQHVLAASAAVFASLAVAVSMPRTKAVSILGSAGVCICIALFASPLAAIKTVLRTKSAESIPLPFAVATTLNCVLWSIVGVLDMKDINIWLPNALGLGCGLLQIALKLIYGDGKRGTTIQMA